MRSGYPCFVVSIFLIGMLTAVIGDLASHFGCTIQLRDSVTAISIVALGTSVPGIRELPLPPPPPAVLPVRLHPWHPAAAPALLPPTPRPCSRYRALLHTYLPAVAARPSCLVQTQSAFHSSLSTLKPD